MKGLSVSNVGSGQLIFVDLMFSNWDNDNGIIILQHILELLSTKIKERPVKNNLQFPWVLLHSCKLQHALIDVEKHQLK